MVIGILKKTLILAAAWTSLVFAQYAGLSARTDSTNFRIGDWIDLHIDGTVAGNVDTIAPAVKDSIGKFAILHIEKDADRLSWTMHLMTIDSGSVLIPPVPFNFRFKGDTTVHQASTNAVLLTIRGIPVDPKADLKDIKPPISAPWRLEDVIPYLIALLIIGVLAYGYYYYRKRQKAKLAAYIPPKPKIAPHTSALFALRELEDKKLWQAGKVKEYYSEATDIIRTFFEERWNFIALELTSDEILRHMQKIPDAEKVWDQMQSFLLTADLVKFAKFVPAPEDNENELRWAYEIVRAMTPSPITAEEEKTAEEAANVG